MSTATERDETMDQPGEIPPALAGPNAPKRTDRPSTWELMRGKRPVEEIHPYWVHVVTASGATLLAANLLSLMTIAWWGWVIAFVVLIFAGGLIGSALTARATHMLNVLGTASGVAWGAATGVLGVIMAAVDFGGNALEATSSPAWLAWAFLTVLGSAVHRWIWGRCAEISDPNTPRGAEYRRRRNGGIWENAFFSANLGNITVERIDERWSGMDVVFRTDPDKPTSFQQIKAAADKVVDLAHKALREEGEEEGLGLGEVQVKQMKQRDLFMLRVRTRDPLEETLHPVIPSVEEFAINDNDTLIHLGYWDTGEQLAIPAGSPPGVDAPHTFAVGTTGSGKSVFLRALQVGFARRGHWTMWAAGLSKLLDLIRPALEASKQVGGRPIFEMWGGGDSGTKGEVNAAERMIVAAHGLYLDRAARASKGKLPGRKGAQFVGTRECPWVALFLDEFDELIKKSADKKLVALNGEKKTAWEMLVELGSKARSYGIELILATQRTTNSWLGSGKSMHDILKMCNKRFLFRTSSASDIGEIIKDQQAKQMAMKLEEMHNAFMATIPGGGDKYRYGKTELWEEEDLVEITRLANELGTLTTIGQEEQAALGDLYVCGAQPTTTAGLASAGTSAGTSKADPSKWGVGDRTDIRRRMAEEMLRATGGPSTSLSRNTEGAEEGLEVDFEGTLAEIENYLENIPEEELEEVRGSVEGRRYPDTPEELLGAILDAWEELDQPPAEMTLGDMVRTFDLEYLDVDRENRETEAAILSAATGALGRQLRALGAEPVRRTSRGWIYAREALQEVYDGLMSD